MSLFSRRSFLAATMPLAVLTAEVPRSSTLKDLKSTERPRQRWQVIITGNSKRVLDGRPRVAHVTSDHDLAMHLAAKHRRQPGRDAYVVRVAERTVAL